MVLVIEHFILLLLQFKQFFLAIFPYYSQMISWLVVCYICSFVCSIGLAHYIARLLNVFIMHLALTNTCRVVSVKLAPETD